MHIAAKLTRLDAGGSNRRLAQLTMIAASAPTIRSAVPVPAMMIQNARKQATRVSAPLTISPYPCYVASRNRQPQSHHPPRTPDKNLVLAISCRLLDPRPMYSLPLFRGAKFQPGSAALSENNAGWRNRPRPRQDV